MCGIVGYIGKKNAKNIVLEGLKTLEYRGYDSCGIAIMKNNFIDIHKSVERIEKLQTDVESIEGGNISIGHTRWATHGKPTILNSHPHTDENVDFAVVHNGIIENYLELKEMLVSKGYSFKSETDTEVIPHLIKYNYSGDLLKAVKKTIELLKGSFALGIMHKGDNKIIVTRRKSPLIIGKGEGENFLASDFSAIIKYTNNIYLLEENEIAELTDSEIIIYSSNLEVLNKDIIKVDGELSDIELAGYNHYMQKEINENDITVINTIKEYINNQNEIFFNLNLSNEDFLKTKHIHIVACGTAMHAGLNGKYIIEKLARITVDVSVASEFRYSNPILENGDLVIFISQSGETADTIAAAELVKDKNIPFISIVNVKNSTLDRMSKNVLYTKAGAEIAVASTKAYIAQVCLIDLFAIYLAKIKKTYLNTSVLINKVLEIPSNIKKVLLKQEEFSDYAKKIQFDKNVFFLGRGLDYYVAMEGSLKLKEISYIHSEAYPAGELKHGPISLIEDKVKVIFICSNKELMEKTISNIKEVKSRGADVLVITTVEDFPKDICNTIINLPQIEDTFSPLLTIIPLQLIAYYTTVLKDLDVDKPRNLAKSVTVE